MIDIKNAASEIRKIRILKPKCIYRIAVPLVGDDIASFEFNEAFRNDLLMRCSAYAQECGVHVVIVVDSENPLTPPRVVANVLPVLN